MVGLGIAAHCAQRLFFKHHGLEIRRRIFRRAGFDGLCCLQGFGDAILALPSRPSSDEARKCVKAISATSAKELKAGNYAQAMADSREAEWFTFATKFLETMGR